MAPTNLDLVPIRKDSLFDARVTESDGSIVTFRWNKATGMDGLKAAYQAVKTPPAVDQEFEDLKAQALAELNK